MASGRQISHLLLLGDSHAVLDLRGEVLTTRHYTNLRLPLPLDNTALECV